MERDKKYKKIRNMLLILLCISLVALIGTEIYKRFMPEESASVSVPGNLIIPEEDSSTDGQTENTENSIGKDSDKENSSAEGNGSANNDNDSSNSGPAGSGTDNDNDGFAGSDTDSSIDHSTESDNNPSNDGSSDSDNNDGSGIDSDTSLPASTVISLHNGQSADNEPFHVTNMLPGDSKVENFCLKVSYKDSGTVTFFVDIHNKPEKLLDVLKLKVVLLNSGDVLYDGLMRDMGELETYTLSKSDTPKTEELYYEISAYLDTSVGNEYMGSTELKADFKWRVDEKANLARAPGKPDYSTVALSLSFITGSLLILKLLPKKHKK